jgi:hypothetical protein
MNIFKFRVIIDTEEDIFRDIEIETNDTFQSLHEAILSAFDFEEGEMASFYMSNDEWERGEEVTLMEMGEGAAPGGIKTMNGLALDQMVSNPEEKIVYVYDFLRMWCFYIELVEVKKAAPSTIYPRVALVFGDAPEQTSKEVDLFGDFEMPDDDAKSEKISTGDPELDAYLNDDDDDDDDDNFTSIDDLDDDRY